MAPYQANTHRYQAVPWRRETTLILTMQRYENFKSKTSFFDFIFDLFEMLKFKVQST